MTDFRALDVVEPSGDTGAAGFAVATPGHPLQLTRRQLTLGVAGLGVASAAGARAQPTSFGRWARSEAFDALVEGHLLAQPAPGLSVAVIEDGEIVRAAAYGFADVAAKRRMRPDTVINIASVTKVITATAVMQMVEAGRVGLDKPVDTYVGFTVRNPAFADDPITPRQLLTHTSSIIDGPAYGASYACGEPAQSLRGWLEGYLRAGGARFDAAANFAARRPGALYGYSNVAFGLLGLVVEGVSGQSFAGYCRTRMFAPLGMASSRFGPAPDASATPYLLGPPTAEDMQLLKQGQAAAETPRAFCHYSFATPPDGLARTSASDLARFLQAYLRGGAGPRGRLLKSSTVEQMFSDQRVPRARPTEQAQGLGWRRRNGAWGHTGGDPGVSSAVAVELTKRRGVVVVANALGDRAALTEQILRAA